VICGAAHIQHALQDEANAMVARCLELGIEEFDTAANYGDSEKALGIALRASGRPRTAYRVHTKIAGTEPRFPTPDWSAAAAEISFAESSALLGSITTIRGHGLRHADRPSPNSPRLRDWCAPLDQALLPGLGKTGGLFAGLRDLRARGLIKAVSLGMDTGNAPAGQRDTRAMGIIDLIREAPEVRLTSNYLRRQLRCMDKFGLLFRGVELFQCVSGHI
jgi:aryl-alcohol dehydrogenase-like predicted oxidoreductase